MNSPYWLAVALIWLCTCHDIAWPQTVSIVLSISAHTHFLYLVDSCYFHILCLWIYILAKFICNPKISTHSVYSWTFVDMAKKKKYIYLYIYIYLPLYIYISSTFPSWDQTRWSSAFLFHSVNRCPFCNLFSATFFCICVLFCWWFCCLKSPRDETEVLSSIPKHRKAVMCFPEKMKC